MPTSWPCAFTYCIGGRVGLVDSVRVRGFDQFAVRHAGRAGLGESGHGHRGKRGAEQQAAKHGSRRIPSFRRGAAGRHRRRYPARRAPGRGMSAAGSGRRGGRGATHLHPHQPEGRLGAADVARPADPGQQRGEPAIERQGLGPVGLEGGGGEHVTRQARHHVAADRDPADRAQPGALVAQHAGEDRHPVAAQAPRCPAPG